MSYRLKPRFKYTLPLGVYLKFLFGLKNKSDKDKIFNKEPIFTINARTGLKLLLNSVSDKKLKVGVQVYTCHTVFQAIIKAGHEIVFIDIDKNFHLDKTDLKCKKELIDILIVTHTFGVPDQLDLIKSIIGGDKIIIEDCSHAFLSKFRGVYVGIQADASIFSTGYAKFPPIGSGGFILANEKYKFPYLDKRVNELDSPSKFHSLSVFIKTLIASIFMSPPLYGAFTYNYGKKIDAKYDISNQFSFPESKGFYWSSVIQMSCFKLFNLYLSENKRNYHKLIKEFNSFPADIHTHEKNQPNYYCLGLNVKNRDDIYNMLLNSDIVSGKHFHKCIEWAAEFGYKIGECPNAESTVKNVLTIPIHGKLNDKQIKTISKLLNENIKKQ